jgi:hypothetical protein
MATAAAASIRSRARRPHLVDDRRALKKRADGEREPRDVEVEAAAGRGLRSLLSAPAADRRADGGTEEPSPQRPRQTRAHLPRRFGCSSCCCCFPPRVVLRVPPPLVVVLPLVLRVAPDTVLVPDTVLRAWGWPRVVFPACDALHTRRLFLPRPEGHACLPSDDRCIFARNALLSRWSKHRGGCQVALRSRSGGPQASRVDRYELKNG